MLGQYPITWLITELLSIVLFVLCMFHALKQEDYKSKVMELICFVVGAGIFEHVGVLIAKTYSYDQHRILMAGVIPLSVLLIEAVILYSSMILFEYLKLPKWTAIWVVGFLCVFQDFSIDPVYINDKYLYNGVMSGQWNWAFKYEGTFFGIPFENFSGWIYMTGIYAAMIYMGGWLNKKYNKDWIKTATPFISGLFLIIPLALIGMVAINGGGARTPELMKLVLNCAFPIILMIIYWNKMEPINLKKDKIIFVVPIALQLYNLAVGFGRGISKSYIPITVCALINFAFLFYLYRKAKKAEFDINLSGKQRKIPLT